MSTNRFDERAATYDDDPKRVERARAVADAIAGAVPLDRSMRLLEYGSGTGLVSQALRDRVGPVTLADSSRGMLDVLRGKVDDGTIPDARVWDLDLARDAVPDERFDLLVSVMVLHHIPDIGPVLRAFASLLEPGAHLCLVDLEAEDGTFHDDDFGGHHGFARDDLERELREAGFADVRFSRCYAIEKPSGTYGLFLATSVRAPAGAGAADR